MKPTFTIVGCGKLGMALAVNLIAAGYPPAGFASRTLASAETLAGVTGCERFSNVAWEMTRDADIVFITTPDGQIETTCAEIAHNGGFHKGAVVLHCSGAHPSTLLSAALNSEAFIGSMHPLQSFATREHTSNPFKGIVISVEGDAPAVALAAGIVDDLEARCFTIRTQAKTLYHAAAVVASNYLVSLLDLAFRLLGEAGIEDKDACAVLYPLIQGTLTNVENVGIRKALTGPIARGDAETVARHLQDIHAKCPELVSLYKSLGRHTLDIGVQTGGISDASVRKLSELLTNQHP